MVHGSVHITIPKMIQHFFLLSLSKNIFLIPTLKREKKSISLWYVIFCTIQHRPLTDQINNSIWNIKRTTTANLHFMTMFSDSNHDLPIFFIEFFYLREFNGTHSTNQRKLKSDHFSAGMEKNDIAIMEKWWNWSEENTFYALK